MTTLPKSCPPASRVAVRRCREAGWDPDGRARRACVAPRSRALLPEAVLPCLGHQTDGETLEKCCGRITTTPQGDSTIGSHGFSFAPRSGSRASTRSGHPRTGNGHAHGSTRWPAGGARSQDAVYSVGDRVGRRLSRDPVQGHHRPFCQGEPHRQAELCATAPEIVKDIYSFLRLPAIFIYYRKT